MRNVFGLFGSVLTLLLCVCVLPLLQSSANAQCYGGRCYGPPAIVAAPVYAQPVIVWHDYPRHTADRPQADNPPASDAPATPPIVPQPDPLFSTCGPHGCYRPVIPVWQPCPQPCPPPCGSPPQYYRSRTSIGVGLEFSWTRKHRYQN